ncbi:MAG: MarR family EPS-associated transcriptional regulator [Syntrophales bacterium]
MAFQPHSHFESDEYLKLLREISADPEISQRELSRRLNLSLGKTNYLLQAIVKKGLIKVESFKNSGNKIHYLYLLTPAGLEEKARVTVRFLGRKMDEYENLKREIALLQEEAGASGVFSPQDYQTG